VAGQLQKFATGWKTKAPVSLQPDLEASESKARVGASEPLHGAELQEARYLRAYLLQRIAIGVLGIAMPIVLVLTDIRFWPDFDPRGSLSAYYYSGTRDWLVGLLCVIAVFLMTYKVAEKNLDNTFSTTAGVTALLVAIFPTNRSPDEQAAGLNLLQEWLGESRVAFVHYVAATTAILMLAVISFFFGVREGRRPDRQGEGLSRHSPAWWQWYHWWLAFLIVLAVLYIGITQAFDVWSSHSLLIGETVALIAFGASWLAKGWERAAFRRLDRIGRGPDGAGSAVDSGVGIDEVRRG